MPTKIRRPKMVLRAALTADGKLAGEISGVAAKDCRKLLENGEVDELLLTVQPKIDGRRGAETLSGKNDEFFPASIRCRLLRMEILGDQCLLHYRITRQARKPRGAG